MIHVLAQRIQINWITRTVPGINQTRPDTHGYSYLYPSVKFLRSDSEPNWTISGPIRFGYSNPGYSPKPSNTSIPQPKVPFVSKGKYIRFGAYLFFLFFYSKHPQTHVDSVTKNGNSGSICMTKDGCFRALCAKLSTLRFAVLGT